MPPRKREGEDTRAATLGRRVQKGRKDRGLSQGELAKALGKILIKSTKDEKFHQSYIARTERGAATPPGPVLRAIAVELNIGYGELLGALLRDHYLEADCADLAYPLEKGLITLDALADWEKAHSEVWVVAQKNIDQHVTKFFDAVSEIVRGGGEFVFFLPLDSSETIERMRARIETMRLQIDQEAASRGKDPCGDRLVYIPLEDRQRLFAAGMVIANPNGGALEPGETEPYPNGYTILNDERGEPKLGYRLSHEEAKSLVPWLSRAKREHLRGEG